MGFGLSHKFSIVRFNSREIKFPEICPVCGKPAIKEGVISSTVFKLGQVSSEKRKSHHKYLQVLGAVNKCNIRCRTPVCEDHYYSSDNSERMKSLLLLIYGISIMAFLLISTRLAFRLMEGARVTNSSIISWISIFVSVLLVWHRLGGHELNEAISISEKSIADTYRQIRVRHDWFRDELLMVNPMNAEVPRYG